MTAREDDLTALRSPHRSRTVYPHHGSLLCAVLVSIGLVVHRPARASAQEWTIEAAADSALRTHPSVRLAEARVRAADAAEAVARAQKLPGLGGTATMTRFEEPMIVAPFHSLDLSSPPDFERALVQSQLGLQYTVFDGGARGARIRAAAATSDALTAGSRNASMALLQEVIAAYTGVLLARQVREAASRQVTALEAELSRAESRFAEGTVARVEVMRAQAALMDAQAEQVTAASAVDVSERRLARAAGVAPSAVAGVPLLDLAPLEGSTSIGSVDSNPLLEAAARTADGARARVDEERAGQLPTFEATAGLRTYGSTAGDFVTEWQTGVALSWPLFAGGARNGRIDRAEAELDAAEAERQQVELEVAAALDSAEAAVSEAAARAQALRASVSQWAEVARIEELALDEGTGVQRDYLTAEAALYRARAQEARARYDEILARAGRAQALGELDRAWIDEALRSEP